MNPEDDFLLGPAGTPSTAGDFASDFARGVKFSPFDLLGAPVDLVNMGLQGIDTMFGRRNVLGSERPFLGSDDLINRYADFVDYLGYDYGRPTNSPGEIAGRVTGGILAPTGGAATFGKGVDLIEAGADAYAAGAPARVAERARTTTLGSGIDPTALIDDMIVARQGGSDAPASIRAYHGSPHDFAPAVRVLDTETGKTYVQEAGDPILTGLMAQNPGKYEIIEENPLGMFDLSKMGTGEGAQAYGEGAYLSGSEDIARGYRDALSSRSNVEYGVLPIRYKGQKFSDIEDGPEAEADPIKFRMIGAIFREADRLSIGSKIATPQEAHKKMLSDLDDIIDRQRAEFSNEPASVRSLVDENLLKSVIQERDALARIDPADIEIDPPGKMYEAEIKVGPEELLDYDEFLYDQAPDIKKRIRDLVESELTEMDAVNLGYDTGKDVDLKAAKEFMLRDDMTIDEFLGNWQALRGSTDAGEFLLKKYGIPGLKYKAAGSRTPGMDEADIDRNYVIFDENIINILRKYGLLAPLVGGGTAAAVMGADEPQPAGGIL